MKKIYILHGWTYSFEKWHEFVSILKHNKIAGKLLKIPGLTGQLDSVWTVNDYSEWLKKEIGDQKVILFGHSNGGRLALYFANQHPENIEKLILLDSAGIYHREFFLLLKRNIFNLIAKKGKKITTSPLMKKLLYRVVGEQDYRLANGPLKETMLNLISSDLTPILSAIKVPTLIIWGEKDQITPLADGKLMNKKIANSHLEIIKSARHSPHFTHPKKTAEVIINYLKNHDL
ncbi:alpha/beta hydrolase [Candidatus Microgenomates bacterium]|nr:alpha/beta hydrolase [Candidatus Microgenomates bacterium]